ncbi:tetratricopeptide repeat protein [Tenacibaculum sp. M341]|uniref:tetratricopeptide repeat protein n=1 Tax=Tenacibaculum sp. M341 TaxID=2530339 RepID=UPI0010445C42|nr:hypothetical protein [Tenacibaculum sp. M341]TCI89981.1 hypothetical protein EYW44_15050 [Tenacibaculum sp. M341]
MNTRLIFFILLLHITIFGFSQTKIDSLKQELSNEKNEKSQLVILDKLTKQMIRKNAPDQEKYLNQTVSLAKKLNDYDLAAAKTRFIVQKYIRSGQSDTAIYIVNRLLKEKNKFTTESSEGHLLLKRAGAYFNKELLDKAIIDYDASANLFLKSGDSIFAADARFFAGQALFTSDNFLKCIKRYEEAYALYDKLGDNEYANHTLAELAIVYGRNYFNDKAIYERNKIIANAKKNGFKSILVATYSNLFTSYNKKNDLKTAKKYLDTLSNMIPEISNSWEKNHVTIGLLKNKISYFLKTNELDSVKENISTLKTKLSANNLKYHNNDLLFNQGRYYQKKKEYGKAQKYLAELLDKNNQIGDVQLIIKANKAMSDVLANQGKLTQSYDYLKKYADAKDVNDTKIKNNSFLYYQSKFEAERKDNEIFKQETTIELLEKDKIISDTKRRTLWVTICAIVLLSILISYYIWRQGIIKRKVLNAKIEKNRKELEEFTQQLINKSKVQESLTEELEKLKEEIGAQKSIEKIQDLTSTKILTQEDWYTFKLKFNRVHPNFFNKLKDKGFNLTKAEERLLALEKLYLDTKQIAGMLAISNDSVTKSRSRLRKKINAPRGSSILEYLEAS